MQIDIAKALATPGWSSERELTWLAERARKSKIIAEIGSWRGRSAIAMAENTDATIFCVDTWADHAIGIPGWWSALDDSALTHWPDWLWKEFRKNTQEYRNIAPKRMTSMQAAEEARLHGVQFDLIFIDADHSYQSVKEDILAWRPLLTDDGVLCGHDFNHPQCPDVAITVDELIPKFVLIDTIWCAL